MLKNKIPIIILIIIILTFAFLIFLKIFYIPTFQQQNFKQEAQLLCQNDKSTLCGKVYYSGNQFNAPYITLPDAQVRLFSPNENALISSNAIVSSQINQNGMYQLDIDYGNYLLCLDPAESPILKTQYSLNPQLCQTIQINSKTIQNYLLQDFHLVNY